MPTINGHPVSYIPLGDVEACALWLPYAKNLLAGLFAVARGSPLSKVVVPDGNTRIELYALGREGKIIIQAQATAGLVLTPRTEQHSMGWGTPLKDDDGNFINDPLGTPLPGDDGEIYANEFPEGVKRQRTDMEVGNEPSKKGNTVLIKKKDDNTENLARIDRRGKNLYFGNISHELQVGGNWHVVSFQSNPSGWRYHTYEDLFTPFVSLDKYGQGKRFFAYKGNKKNLLSLDEYDGVRVLSAAVVQTNFNGQPKQIRVYSLECETFTGNFTLKSYSLGELEGSRPKGKVLWASRMLEKSHLSTDEFYAGEPDVGDDEWTMHENYKKWVMYSIPQFKPNGTEMVFLIASQGMLDTSVNDKVPMMSFGDYESYYPSPTNPHASVTRVATLGLRSHLDEILEFPIQKYLAVLSIGASAATFHIERIDADTGSTTDFQDKLLSYSGTTGTGTEIFDVSEYWLHARIQADDTEFVYYKPDGTRKKVIRRIDSRIDYAVAAHQTVLI